MTAYKKPSLEMADVEIVIMRHFESSVLEITPLTGGNMSQVYSFSSGEKQFVIKFSDTGGAFEAERFMADLLSPQGVPFPQCVGSGNFASLSYTIFDKVTGHDLVDCSVEEQQRMLPELIEILTIMNHVDLGETSGYGLIISTEKGSNDTWTEFIASFYAEEQTGFWEGWHDLFHTTCLEKDVFDECYNRMMTYAPYNESHRYFIHGDFHPWNIMSDGVYITGIIDGNCTYGDFLIDVVTLAAHMKQFDIIQAYQDLQQQKGISIPDFKERIVGAKYYKGLDAMRFYAKMGWNDAYFELRDELLSLE